jgi:LCP family protein required for cell wall assembly
MDIYSSLTPRRSSRSRTVRTVLFWLLLAALVAYASAAVVRGLTRASISVVNNIRGITPEPVSTGVDGKPLPRLEDDPEYEIPDNNKKRLDVLLLGIRGEGDAVNGGLLTDTILLLSVDTKTSRASLTSIPRDLTVRLTDGTIGKVNAAYATLGMKGARTLMSRITGVYIDNIVILDFEAFKYIVDTLGGVTITLDRPFSEPTQWGYEFTLPEGANTLTGEQALYYVRSRYGSSDFDRSRRQMQVMLAIKEQAMALDLSSDPIRALDLVKTVRKHIVTDLDILDIGTIRDLMGQGSQIDRIRRYQLTPENVLFETKVDGIYELLPRDGTLAGVKEFFRTVLDDEPVLPRATPEPTATP